ncbi:polar amino acid transport system substrate-binding protein [Bradyrhizobium sp. LM4.3]
MPTSLQSALAGLVLAAAVAMPALADGLKDDIAPSGKLRVAIAISPAGGAFWSTKTEAGYAGVPVDLGKEMAAQLGVPVEYVVHQNSGQITDAASKSTLEKGAWDVTWLPKDPERETRMMFGPIYEVADATYIVKAGSSVTDFATLDQVGIKVAAVNATTTMRGAVAHLKNAKVTGYQTYDEIFGLLSSGEIDAFALSRDQAQQDGAEDPGHEGAGRDLQEDGHRGRRAARPQPGTGFRHQVHDGSDDERHASQGL